MIRAQSVTVPSKQAKRSSSNVSGGYLAVEQFNRIAIDLRYDKMTRSNIWAGRSIDWTYIRRYDVVGDLMRPSGSPQAPPLTAISYPTL
eukprot:scaffold25982_cov96-Skeletonema_dohrnii-CCMP3373.AAC.1